MSKIQPKSGANHKLFGTKFLKLHSMRNEKWTPTDKITQYNCMVVIHEKNRSLLTLKANSDYTAQKEKFKEEVANVNTCRSKLKEMQSGETQRIKNIFQNHRAMQILYPNLSTENIVNNVDSKTFDKRKRFDRLWYKRKQLTANYEKQLNELSKLQDRIKYQDTLELKDERLAKLLRAQLKDSETRISGLKVFQRNSNAFIDTLIRDSMYYDLALSSLQDDITEQTKLTNTTIHVGRPAIINVDKYNEDYEMQEKTERNETQIRLATLTEYRQKLVDNKLKIKKLVRGDNDFEVYPDRYVRETQSIVSLRTAFSKVQNDMTELCAAVACRKSEDVLTSFNFDLAKAADMKEKTVSLENLLHDVTEKFRSTKGNEDRLINNYSSADASHDTTSIEIENGIKKVQARRQDIKKKLETRRKDKFQLQNSLQHLCSLLQHVGSPRVMIETKYKSSILNLPLLELQYGTTETTEYPLTIQDDIGELLDTLASRVNLLVDMYHNKEGEYIEKINLAQRTYHENTLAVMEIDDTKALAPTENDLFDVGIDPQLMNRNKIKENSQKVVAERANKDD